VSPFETMIVATVSGFLKQGAKHGKKPQGVNKYTAALLYARFHSLFQQRQDRVNASSRLQDAMNSRDDPDPTGEMVWAVLTAKEPSERSADDIRMLEIAVSGNPFLQSDPHGLMPPAVLGE
jgi:hypothetical protein